ncbi:hypothetical protein X737_37895 [Mesorhizobium sp. L48C026A00]|nr:hypothetical protein X737_37895 [Mesorhizobium sp. L48C026A00]
MRVGQEQTYRNRHGRQAQTTIPHPPSEEAVLPDNLIAMLERSTAAAEAA